jgi:peptidyl-tRNA hydrolase, PTH1 family
MFLDYIAKKCKADGWEFDKKLNSEATKCKLEKMSVILAKPLTYVNKSGDAVKKLAKTYKSKPDNLAVIQDDLDIPFGNTKLSFDRNSGGHKGVESVMRALKTKKFYRLRIGLSTRSLMKARQQSPKKRDQFVHDFVLSKFSKKEREDLKTIFKDAYAKLLSL